MHNSLLELDLVAKHQEKFKQKVLNIIDCLQEQKVVEILPAGGDGPALVIMQNDKRVAHLECYHGMYHDYRLEYAQIIKEILSEHGISVIMGHVR